MLAVFSSPVSTQDDQTLSESNLAVTVSFSPSQRSALTLPCLTILYHPDLSRVGERVTLEALLAGRTVSLTRQEPEFAAPGSDIRRGLDVRHISRQPIRLRGLPGGGLSIDVSETGTRVAVDGAFENDMLELSAAALEHGVVLELASRVVLLAHVLKDTGEPMPASHGMIGESDAIWALRRELSNLAGLDVSVLVRGETGTGKELIAEAVHRASGRTGPFISVNLGALPASLAGAELFGASKGAYTGASRPQRGYFRQAHGGTLFLDEIGEASIEVQVMLLRALETGEITPLGTQRSESVDVRVIAATDADLDDRIAAGAFRAPLLHRLGQYELWIPPLRQRRDDIGRLLVHFLDIELKRLEHPELLAQNADTRWLPAPLVSQLARHDWPGNVRELKNAASQLAISGRHRERVTLGPALARRLPPALDATGTATPPPGDDALASAKNEPRGKQRRKPGEVTEQELLEALRAHRWDLKATAGHLALSRTSLYARIDASPNARRPSEVSDDEIRACHARTRGLLDAMVEELQVSGRALKRRLNELSLPWKG